MAGPTLLAIRAATSGGTGNAKVYRLVGGSTATQVGNDVGTSNLEKQGSEVPSNSLGASRVVQFGDEIYAWQQNKVYRFDDPGWTVVHTVSNQNTTGNYVYHSGLYPVFVGSTFKLVGLYRDVSNATRMLDFDGSTWTETLVSSATYRHGNQMFVYRNTFWFPQDTDGGAGVFQFDPSIPSVTHYAGNVAGLGGDATWGVYDNELYVLGFNSAGATTGRSYLWRFSGGAWANVQAIGSTVVSGGLYNQGLAAGACQHALFAWDGDFYAIVFGSTSSGGPYRGNWCFKLVENGSTFTESNISNPVLPASIRAGYSLTAYGAWCCFIDNDTDPENPKPIFYYNPQNESRTAGTWSFYEWVDASTVLSGGSSIGSWGIYLPWWHQGGGERIWTSGENNIQLTGAFDPVPGGMKLYFQGFGSGTAKAKFWYSPDEETPEIQCVLTGDVTGGTATRNGNQVENITLDNGVTTYSFIWQFGGQTPALSVGDKTTVMPEVFV